MSVPFSSFSISAPQGIFSYDLRACNPQQIVSFDPVNPDCHEVEGFFGTGVGKKIQPTGNLMVISYNTEPTIPDQNPVRLEIRRFTSDTKEYTGDSIVLYGFFLKPYADQLRFYVNLGQSQKGFMYGNTGIDYTNTEYQSTITVK